MILTSNYILDFVFHATFLYLFGLYIQSILRTPAALLVVSLGLAALVTFVNHMYLRNLRMSLAVEAHNPYCPRCPCATA